MTLAHSRLSRRIAALAAGTALGLVAFASTPLASSADAAPGYTAAGLRTFDEVLAAKINHVRAAHGLHPLTVVAGTTDVAHHWSCHLADSRTLAHNGNLESALESHGSNDWSMYSENVGMESADHGAKYMFRLYMNSADHRANILQRSARFVGIWTTSAHGLRWNTIDFVGSTSSAYNNGYGGARVGC